MNDQEDDNITIGEVLKDINPAFLDWVEQIFEFDIIRTLQINTFLANFLIALNYFPSFNLLIEWFSKRAEYHKLPRRTREFTTTLEKIHGIFIFKYLITKY